MTKPHWPPGPYWERGTAAGVAAAVEAGAVEEAAAGVMEVGATVACAYDGLLCCLFGSAFSRQLSWSDSYGLRLSVTSVSSRVRNFVFSRQLSVVRLVRIAAECHFGVIPRKER